MNVRYFTDELWNRINSESIQEREKANLEWDNNSKEYLKEFETIKSRISKRFLKIYQNNYGFHDFRIRNIVVNHKERGHNNPVSVEIIIENSHCTINITYKRIVKFSINYEGGHNPYFGDSRGFDDWGYDELLPVDEHVLSHEVLFASGSTILVYFHSRNISVMKKDRPSL